MGPVRLISQQGTIYSCNGVITQFYYSLFQYIAGGANLEGITAS